MVGTRKVTPVALPWGAGADGPEAMRIERVLQGSHYQHIGWSCGENDWVPGIDADPTSDAVRLVIETLRDSMTFVRLDQTSSPPRA